MYSKYLYISKYLKYLIRIITILVVMNDFYQFNQNKLEALHWISSAKLSCKVEVPQRSERHDRGMLQSPPHEDFEYSRSYTSYLTST